jgi:hypothetical protein
MQETDLSRNDGADEQVILSNGDQIPVRWRLDSSPIDAALPVSGGEVNQPEGIPKHGGMSYGDRLRETQPLSASTHVGLSAEDRLRDTQPLAPPKPC